MIYIIHTYCTYIHTYIHSKKLLKKRTTMCWMRFRKQWPGERTCSRGRIYVFMYVCMHAYVCRYVLCIQCMHVSSLFDMYVCMYVLYLHRFKEHLRKEKEKFDLATKKSLEVNKRNRENNTKRDMMVRHRTYTFVCTYVCMYVCMYVLCVCYVWIGFAAFRCVQCYVFCQSGISVNL